MRPAKIAILLLALIVTISLAEIVIKSPKPSDSGFVEATVKMLTTCYRNKGSVGLTGDIPDALLTTLWSKKVIPVILTHPTKRTVAWTDGDYLFTNPNKKIAKLNVFLMVIADYSQFEKTYLSLRMTRWYNHLGSFLVLFSHETENIREFGGLLHLFFRKHIYNVNLMIFHRRHGRLLYTLNPYTHPKQYHWYSHGTVNIKRSGLFSLYSRKYGNGTGICENLHFDKTIDLGGREIDMLVPTEYVYYPSKESSHHQGKYNIMKLGNKAKYRSMKLRNNVKYEDGNMSLRDRVANYIVRYGKFTEYSSLTFENILMATIRQMNATFKLSTFNRRLVNYELDVRDLSPPDYYGNYIGVPKSYPISYQGNLIMVQYRGYKTQLHKIVSVVDVNTRIGVCLVALITVVFFKYFCRQALGQSTLNVLRITCNMGFTNLPQNIAPKVYLGCLLFFVVTMQGIFVGNLACLLTTDVPVRHPNTRQDLSDLGYTVYTWKNNVPYFTDPQYEIRVVEMIFWDCCELAVRDPSVACVDTDTLIIDAAKHLHLYASSQYIINRYAGFVTAVWWPYEKRFNKIFSVIHEADVRAPLSVRITLQSIREAETEAMNNTIVRIMTLNDLKFAFIILGSGLGCAAICFLVEISIKHVRFAIAKARRTISKLFRYISVKQFLFTGNP